MGGKAQEKGPLGCVIVTGFRFSFAMVIERIQGVHRLDNNMPVRATIAEGRHTCSTDLRVLRPWRGVGMDLDIPIFFQDCIGGDQLSLV